MKNNKGAIQLSIGTVVVIVIAMAMLILGLVLVRNIFSGATESVNILNDKVKSEITALFADEQADVIVKLGSDKLAKVKPDSGPFGIGIGARTLDGSATDRTRLQYKITVESPTLENCAKRLGVKGTENLFVTPVNTFIPFDEYQGANSFAIVQVDIPKGTQICSQKVLVDVRDTQTNQPIGGSFFIIEITKGGIF
jgi:hypothetical protein